MKIVGIDWIHNDNPFVMKAIALRGFKIRLTEISGQEIEMIETLKLMSLKGVQFDAEIINDITETNLSQWHQKWFPITFDPKIKEKNGFDWEFIVSEHSNDSNSLLFSLMCNGETEGMMVLSLNKQPMNGNKFPANGNRLVYVEYVEVAPWNQHFFGKFRKFKNLGSLLIAHAAKISRLVGCNGSLGLHSIPESETFYRSSMLMDLGKDSNGLNYFELNSGILDSIIID